MITTHKAREFVQTAELTSHVSNFFNRLWNAYQEWRKRARLRDILYGLPDRELRDIGISRSEIEYLVMNGSDERGPLSGDTDMRSKVGGTFAWLPLILAVGCFIATPADAKLSNGARS